MIHVHATQGPSAIRTMSGLEDGKLRQMPPLPSVDEDDGRLPAGPHTVHSHTVHLALRALLSPCTVCGTGTPPTWCTTTARDSLWCRGRRGRVRRRCSARCSTCGARPHMVHSHTVRLPLGAPLIRCAMCGCRWLHVLPYMAGRGRRRAHRRAALRARAPPPPRRPVRL